MKVMEEYGESGKRREEERGGRSTGLRAEGAPETMRSQSVISSTQYKMVRMMRSECDGILEQGVP